MIGGMSAGDGRYSMTASNMNCTPLFLSAEPHITGMIVFAMTALRSVLRRSSSEISLPSK